MGLESQAPPPPYPGGDNIHLTQPQMSPPSAAGLVSVDFIPGCTKPGGIFTWAEFEPFTVILQRANEWMSKNPTLLLKTCETVEFNTQATGAVVNSLESVYTLWGEGSNRFVRGLRLWMQPRTDGSSTVQQVGYYNIMPSVRVGVFSVDTAERLDTLIAQANSLFATNPIQGKILTIETVVLHVGLNGVDPDCTAWTEHGSTTNTFVYMLRIFYETGPPQYESIGIADFVPGVLSEGGLLGRPVLERFPQVLAKAHQWLLAQPPHMRVANVQTLNFKQRWTAQIDTLRMTYTDNDYHAYFVRYLRVAYVFANPNAPPPNDGPVRLNCKLFAPGMLEPPKCCSVGVFENQMQVRERMSGWMRATGAKVLSVETVPMRIFSGAETVEGFDTMHTWNNVVHYQHQHGGAGHHHHGGHHGGHHHHHGGHHHHAGFHHGHNLHHHHNHHHGHMLHPTGFHSRGIGHSHTHHAKGSETYLILYRVYLDGVYQEPMGYTEGGINVEMYMQQNANACTIL